MGVFQTNRELVFSGPDLLRPRMTVEREKLMLHFPQFSFYGVNGQPSSVQGNLSTSYGNSYSVRISIPAHYPYELPEVTLPYHTISSGCPHTFVNGKICIMKSAQWTSTFSLAFVVAKTAVWLNKYDYWRMHGKWPGKQQRH